jgi:hypothetical protein
MHPLEALELPWWFVLLIYFVIFMLYCGIGILLGALCACLLTARTRPENRSPTRFERLAPLLVGGLAGGAVQCIAVSIFVSYAL